jgi:hypothetical protein
MKSLNESHQQLELKIDQQLKNKSTELTQCFNAELNKLRETQQQLQIDKNSELNLMKL